MEGNNIHKGKLLKEMVESSGMAISHICEKIGKSRPTLYRWFEQEFVSPEIMNKIRMIIREENYEIDYHEENKKLWEKIEELELQISTLKTKIERNV